MTTLTPLHESLDLHQGELSLRFEYLADADSDRGWSPAYHFTLRLQGVAGAVGRISFRLGNSANLRLYAGHIGYDVDPPHRGHHLAERASRLLLPLARKHRFTELWITCDPENIASRRTCERLDAALVEIVDVPRGHPFYLAGVRRKCRYLLTL